MKRQLEPSAAPAQQAHGCKDAPLRLSECGDTLTVNQVCAVFQISRSHYYALVSHRKFPIKPLKDIGATRYAKVAIESYLAGQRRSA